MIFPVAACFGFTATIPLITSQVCESVQAEKSPLLRSLSPRRVQSSATVTRPLAHSESWPSFHPLRAPRCPPASASPRMKLASLGVSSPASPATPLPASIHPPHTRPRSPASGCLGRGRAASTHLPCDRDLPFS